MYLPKYFEETRTEVLHELIRTCAFGTLITMTSAGLEASHIPFVLDTDPLPFGTLRAHIARANSQWQTFSPDVEALVIFYGPNSYISPSWYPTKQETGKVVPTWNYVVVHAYGRLRIEQDPAWLRTHVEELTDQHELARDNPWHVSDAPSDFTQALLGAIVGVELHITRLIGKWKLGQNRPIADQEGILKGRRLHGNMPEPSLAKYMKVPKR